MSASTARTPTQGKHTRDSASLDPDSPTLSFCRAELEVDRQLGSVRTTTPSAASPAALQALEQYKKKDASKGKLFPQCQTKMCSERSLCCSVVVRFKAIGNAPIMKVSVSCAAHVSEVGKC